MFDANGSGGTAGLMTLAEIAQLAGVSRPAATNWRRRFPDFPAPAGLDPARPQFAVGEVIAWLLAHGGLGHAEPSELRFEAALHSVSAYAAQFGPARLLQITSALLCLRALDDGDEPLVAADFESEPDGRTDFGGESAVGSSGGEAARRRAWARIVKRAQDEDEDDEFLLAEIENADIASLALARLADALTEAAYGAGNALERLLAARHRLGMTELTVHTYAPQLAILIARLSGARVLARRTRSVAIADMRAGAGDVLQALAEDAGLEVDVTVLAAEPDVALARLARRRMLARGIGYLNLDLQVGTELRLDLAEPDVAVVGLPYEAAEGRDGALVFAEVRRALAACGDHYSRFLVFGPADALVGRLTPMSRAEQERQRLLDSNLVEAVIRLPGGMLPFRSGYQSALWILRREPVAAARGRVLLCDVSAQPLTAEVARDLIQDVGHWRTTGYDEAAYRLRFGAPVLIRELAQQPGVPLDPPRKPSVYDWVHGADERVSAIRQAEAELAEQQAKTAELPRLLPAVPQRRTDQPPTRTTLGALIASRRIEVVPGLRLDAAHVGADGEHAVIGTAEVTRSASVGGRRIDLLALAAHYGQSQLTEPGDVVVCVSDEVNVLIDERGANIVEFPARALRMRAENRADILPTPRVLAALLSVGRGVGRAQSAVRPSRRLEDLELPVLKAHEIRHYDDLLRALHQRRELIVGQLAALDRVHELTARGVTNGTLTVRSPSVP